MAALARALSTLHAFSAGTREELLRYLVRANVRAARARQHAVPLTVGE